MAKGKKETEVQKASRLFNLHYNSLKQTVEHIERAISGSEIDTDLDYIEDELLLLRKYRKEM